jgi:hypothetical protein
MESSTFESEEEKEIFLANIKQYMNIKSDLLKLIEHLKQTYINPFQFDKDKEFLIGAFIRVKRYCFIYLIFIYLFIRY